MQSSNCYTGQILRVDLSKKISVTESLNADWAHDYIGGKGLGFRYLIDALPANVDPLSSDNVIGFFPGALAGTCVATTSRTAIVCRSPATGTILDSYVGGAFGLQLKLAGYDGVVITGRSPDPVYLLILDDRVEIREATRIWGKSIWETEELLQEEVGEADLVTLIAGPAGENLVPFACVTSEGYRQAGRGGVGAVFGSKNLKAVAVHGTGAVRVPDMKSFMAAYEEIFHKHLLTEDNLWTYDEGTPGIVDAAQECGLLPTRGFRESTFEGASNINLEALQKRKKKNRACAACPLACGQLTQSKVGLMEGPEFETLGMGGANCGIDDLDAVTEFNRICDNLGLDTISTGNVIGLAMRMTEEDIHDFNVHFGNVEEYLAMTEDIAYLRGLGAELAKGGRYIAQKFGAEHLVMENKGLEFPAYDPRGSFGMALAYGTADRGGCHMRAFPVGYEAFGDMDPFTLEDKAHIVIMSQDFNAAKWTGIFCDFWDIGINDIATLISSATGRTYHDRDIHATGERIWNLGRLFNLREGFSREDDYPPAAVFDQSLTGGPAAGKNPSREEYADALDEYYHMRGWTKDGVPTPEKLDALGLSELAV